MIKKKENYFRIVYFLLLSLFAIFYIINLTDIKARIIASLTIFIIGILFIVVLEYILLLFDFKKTMFSLSGLFIGIIFGKVINSIFIDSIPERYKMINIMIPLITGYFFIFFFYINYNKIGFFKDKNEKNSEYKLLDTSVIIDGRIINICKTGFLEGVLLLPKFVMNEIQLLSDSADAQKRIRGKRALDKLQEMRESGDIMLQIIDDDYDDIHEVDRKLLRLAKKKNASLLTNDHNLNKIARMENIKVLNINDLAVSLKLPIVTGQRAVVSLIREGKETSQALAYLDDGTMIVVDNGRNYIGQNVEVEITQLIQNPSGRMIFAKFIKLTNDKASFNKEYRESSIKQLGKNRSSRRAKRNRNKH